jgi:ESCRT-II complex subunit VPS36
MIPPKTLLQVLPYLPTYTSPPIHDRKLSSGLMVLHTPQYTHSAFAARLTALLELEGAKTAAEVSRTEDLTVGMTMEMINAVEADGSICRDETGDEKTGIGVGGVGEGGRVVRWWRNIFEGYVWDGHEF